MSHLYTSIVITMEMAPYQVLRFYCGRGKKENYIREGKSGFGFACVSSSSKVVNANRLMVHALAYNLFNWFRRVALAANMRKQQIATIWLKLTKIAARVVRMSDYIAVNNSGSLLYPTVFAASAIISILFSPITFLRY